MKVVFEAPLSWGVSVVRVTWPAAFGATRMSSRSVRRPAGRRALDVDLLRAGGRVGRDRDVERDLGRGRAAGRLHAVDGEAAAAQDRCPAGRDLADRQGDAAGLVGRDRRRRSSGCDRARPRWPGTGVVSVIGRCGRRGRGAPTSNASPSIDATRPSLAARDRAFRPDTTDTEPPPRTISIGGSWGTAATGRATIRGPGRRRV